MSSMSATPITNQWLGLNRETVLANTAAYNAEVPPAGRKEALLTLKNALDTQSSVSCIVLSDLLGAGKTFFVQHAFSQFSKERGWNEEEHVATLLVDEVESASDIEQTNAQIIIVDDLDRKAEWPLIENAVAAVQTWLRDRRLAILIGDYSLQNQALLAGLPKPQRILLEPLTRDLLSEAIYARLYHWLRQKPLSRTEETAAAEADAAIFSMFQEPVLDALLPPTDPQVATFRETFGMLQEMAELLPLTTQPCQFTPDTCRAWLKKATRLRERDPDRIAFVRGLHDAIRMRAQSRERWKPLDAGEWSVLLSIPGNPNEIEF